MADKAISDLIQATQITGEDLFVLQQNGEAKKLKGSQVVQYAKDSVAAEVQGVKEYADSAKASADAAAKDATRAETAARGIDDKVAAADAFAKAAASSAAAAAASATGVDEKVQAAQTAADNAAKSETAAKTAQTGAANAQKAAESAQTGAQAAKTAAESAQEAAESAKDAAAGSSTAAGQKATQAAQSAEDAASAKSAAETAKTDAQAARDAIVNMIVEAVTLASGSDATVSKSVVDNVFKLVFGIPRGNPGADAPTITGITIRQTDYHMIVSLSDGTTYDAGYCRGASGAGTGDMLASVYDPTNKHQDIFAYVDNAIKDVKVTTDATPTQGSTNPVQSGGVYSALANKLGKPTNAATATVGQLLTKTADGQEWADAAGGDVFIIHATVEADNSVTPQESFDDIRSAYSAGKVLVLDIGQYKPMLIAEAGSRQETGVNIVYFQGILANGASLSMVGTLYSVGCVLSGDYFGKLTKKEILSIDAPSEADDGKILAAWYDSRGEYGGTEWKSVIPATTSLLKGDGSGGLVAATPETDYASPIFSRKVTLTVAGWNSSTKQQTVTCAGILADTTKQCIYPAPVDTSYDSAWNSCGVLCVAQAANSLTFQCSEIPTSAIEAYVTVITLNYKGVSE